MKGSITTTTTFKAILVITFLFAAFLALAITYNKAYKMKNQTISIIEKYEGIIKYGDTLTIVNNYLRNNGYNTKGPCDIGEYGVSDLTINEYEIVTNEKDLYYYCLNDNKSELKKVNSPVNQKIYYTVKIFFKFDLPFIGDILTFDVMGETKGIHYYSEKQKLQ